MKFLSNHWNQREALLTIKESDDEEIDEDEETNSKVIHISDIEDD